MPTQHQNTAQPITNGEHVGTKKPDAANIIKDFVAQNVIKPSLPHNGRWSNPDAVGNSDFIIADNAKISWTKNGEHSSSGAELKQWMKKKYGRSAVTYSHNEPDFKPFADKMIGLVRMNEMTPERSKNFIFAKQEAAKRMGFKTLNEVRSYMKQNELTWHECADGHTILAVPTRIHAAFQHLGGISITKSTQSINATVSEQIGNLHIDLIKTMPTIGTITGLENAIKTQHKRFKGKKKLLFPK